MNLDEAQKKTVAQWVAEGLKLSDIQKRLSSELGVSLTYMEVRLLVDDLKLTPKDVEPPRPAELTAAAPAKPTPGKSPLAEPESGAAPAEPQRGAGGVSVQVDNIARPGSVVSGRVTFSDGKRAEWYLDQMGRLGLAPEQQGYRPSQSDLQTFQSELQNALARYGF